MQGRVVADRYDLVRPLGRGGMGAVWLAADRLAGRQVAVKELRAPDGLGADEREVFAKRALQEARSAARIQHPNAVVLHDIIPATADDDAIYLIMEYVEGETLGQEMQRAGPLSESRVTTIGLDLVSVLQAAHGLGIVHRDIKPANIMITHGGQAKLTDFGIAHTAGETRLTGSGVMGTPAYMAPELFESGAMPTPAADLWSLGATLYHAASGHNPFGRDSTAATLRAILMDPPPAPANAGPLFTAIAGLLQRDPARRITIPQVHALLSGAPHVHPERHFPHPPTIPVSPGVARPGEVARFTSMPRFLRYALLAGWAMLITGAVAGLAAGAAGHDSAGLLAAVALPACAAAYPLLAGRLAARWPFLTVGPQALVVEHGADGGRRKLTIGWDEITRLGPVSEGGAAYLCAWRNGGPGVIAAPVRLCPLGTPHFPAARIRDAILAARPTALIDPMLRTWRADR